MLAGSTGFTLIKHKCYVCGQEDIRSSISLVLGPETLCCHDNKEAGCHHNDRDECVIDNDSCSHETEKMVSDDIARSEVQPEIIPFTVASTIVTIVSDQTGKGQLLYLSNEPDHHSHDLTTLHCQILA